MDVVKVVVTTKKITRKKEREEDGEWGAAGAGGRCGRGYLRMNHSGFNPSPHRSFPTFVTQHVTVEIQTDCLMVRGGSSADTAIVQLYHNDDRCNDDTKHEYAKRLAEFLCQYLRVPEDR